MKFLMSILFVATFLFSSDATIEVVKKVDSLPTLALEDASNHTDNLLKMKFFKMLVADMNVISVFNVDRHYRNNEFDSFKVLNENNSMNYVLRYNIYEDDSKNLNVSVKLIQDNKTTMIKNYKISNSAIYMFVSHAIAYDINEFMGEKSVEWMKKKVIFSRIVGNQKSELVIADYTLSYQHTIISGGFNVFPKWADKNQQAFYYTSLDGNKPVLKYVDTQTGRVETLLSSDGMLICSDVSEDGKELLLTMAPSGQPDVYLYNVLSKKYQRLTKYGGIDVNGQFMGKDKIIFISERLGYPNVFSKNLVTNEVEQMVYYGNSNSSCSVNGEYIVYKARESSNSFSNNTFNLHLISTKTDFIRRLTATGINEFPRFSKDGDAILFIKNYKSQSSIGIIRLNHNKNYLFPLSYGRVQSMDW